MRRLVPVVTLSVVGIILASMFSASCHLGSPPHAVVVHHQCLASGLTVATPDSREVFRQMAVTPVPSPMPGATMVWSLVAALAAWSATILRWRRRIRWVWARGVPFPGGDVFVPYLAAVRDM